jgi:pimeloyl-ACP methyl ester carboxylesterase
MPFSINKEQWNALNKKFGNSLIQKCLLENRHVVVFFQGWNAPWQETGGKTIPADQVTTIAAIRRDVVSGYNAIQKQGDTLATEAYATDTDDDVKILAREFVKSNRRGNGKVIIYGYSWGGDTAVELAKDLNDDGVSVDLLITIDAALGIFNGPAVRDRTIPENVEENRNHYTKTPNSMVGSRGLPNWAKNPTKTTVDNIAHKGPSHGEMDEVTKADSVSRILNELAE